MQRFTGRIRRMSGRLTWRFLSYFLIILFIPLVTVYFAYCFLTEIAYQEAYQESLKLLEQSRIAVNSFNEEIQTIANQLSYDSEIGNFISLANAMEDSRAVSQVIKSAGRLRNYYNQNRYISDIIVYSTYNGMAIGKSTVEIGRDKCWETILRYREFTPEKFREFVDERKGDRFLTVTGVNFTNRGKKQILFLRKLQVYPFMSFYGSNVSSVDGGILIIAIAPEHIESILKASAFALKGGSIYITDGQGAYMAGSPIGEAESRYINGKLQEGGLPKSGYFRLTGKNGRWMVFYNERAQGGWYVGVIPEEYLLQNFSRNMSYVRLTLAVTLFICILIAYVLSRKMARPVYKIAESIGQDIRGGVSGKNSVFASIYNYVNDLREENLSKSDLLDRQMKLTKHVILYRLLYGGFESEEDYETFVRRHGLPPITGRFIPLLICVGKLGEFQDVSGSDRLQLMKAYVKKETTEVFPTDLIVDIDYNLVTLVYQYEGGEDDIDETRAIRKIIEDGIKELATRLRTRYEISVVAYGGNICTSPIQISFSFRNARLAMETLPSEEGRVVWFEEKNPNDTDAFYFPETLEKMLVNSIRSGEIDESLKHMERVRFENVYRRQISAEATESLGQKLREIYIRLIFHIYGSDVPERIVKYKGKIIQACSFEALYETLRELSIELCMDIDKRKKDSCWQIAEAVMDLVGKNYGDGTFNLKKLAKKMGYSEPYLSTLFHTATGEQFSRYMERIRLNAACELLEKERISIEEIAEKVGYGSVNAFRRAFKKVYSVTPGMYREKHRCKD